MPNGKMPHKTRKLVLCDPKDSGTTSWVQVLLGVIPLTNARETVLSSHDGGGYRAHFLGPKTRFKQI